MNRLPWVDYLKAIGIIAVALGHSLVPPWLIRWMYSFHIPLFFIVTGVLLSSSAFQSNFGEFYRKRLSKLLRAYWIFAILGFVHFCVLSQLGDKKENLLLTVKAKLFSLVYASGTIAAPWNLQPTPMWFFPALISALVICYFVGRLPKWLFWPGVLLTLGVGLLLRHTALPWELESGFCAAFFIFLGYAFSHPWKGAEVLARFSSFWAIPCFALGAYLSYANGLFDFRGSVFGNVLLSIPSCLLTLTGFYLLLRSLPVSKIATRISEATLLIFPTHIITFWVVDTVVIRTLGMKAVHNYPYQFTRCFAVVAATVLVYPLFARWFGFAGKEKPRASAEPLQATSPAR